VNTIEQILARVPVTEGFAGLHLVEVATGQVLASVVPSGSSSAGATSSASIPAGAAPAGAGPPLPLEPLVGALTDTVQLLSTMVATAALDEDLEDLVVTLTGHHHLVRLMPGFAGTDAFLLLSLDRARANLAMARHLLLAFEAGLVA
jgi:hypothetical protein